MSNVFLSSENKKWRKQTPLASSHTHYRAGHIWPSWIKYRRKRWGNNEQRKYYPPLYECTLDQKNHTGLTVSLCSLDDKQHAQTLMRGSPLTNSPAWPQIRFIIFTNLTFDDAALSSSKVHMYLIVVDAESLGPQTTFLVSIILGKCVIWVYYPWLSTIRHVL